MMLSLLAKGSVCAGALPAIAFAACSSLAIAQTTPFGAEAGANADGSIPAYNGGLSATTSNGSQFSNPFAGDQMILKIDQSNVDQHAARLSAGQIAMIKRHSSYFIPVYQTRRTFRIPDSALQTAVSEAGGISLVNNGNGLSGLVKSTIPFPNPKSGVELIWNHLFRYQTPAWERNYAQAPVQSNGAYTLQRLTDVIAYRSGLPAGGDNENILAKFLQVIKAPARLEGNVLLVHDTLDQVKEPRSAWVYNAGQRRVRRAPNIAYDGPGTAAEGMRTTDDFGMFNGAPDKYDWNLVGKREMYLPANSYSLVDPSKSYTDVIGDKHLNQALTRYELRRAWVVEGTLKSGERHIYGKRVFYFDEDGYQIKLGDQFDNRGELWRVKEGHNAIESTGMFEMIVGEPIYDLQSGRYIVLSLLNEERPQFRLNTRASDGDFTPSALRRKGRK
ncbi:MAG: DUF1329 domain-containing protein [Pseudomonadota bacterium]